MALITDQPEGLATTDALDAIRAADAANAAAEGGERAEIYLSGAHVATLDNAPDGLGRITLMVELEVTEESKRFAENGETVIPIRRCRRVGDMWRPGTQRPPSREELREEQIRAKAQAAREQAERDEAERAEAEHNEPPMFDEDGNPVSDDAPKPPTEGDGILDAEVVEDDEDQGDEHTAEEMAEVDPNVVEFSSAKPKGGGK